MFYGRIIVEPGGQRFAAASAHRHQPDRAVLVMRPSGNWQPKD